MRTGGALLSIVAALVGCGGPAREDGVSTVVGEDSAIQNYDEQLTFTSPVSCSVYLYDTVLDLTNYVAEYDVRMRPGGSRLAVTYRIVPSNAHPLQLFVNVGKSAKPILSFEASADELLVLDDVQETVFDEKGYLAPVLDAGLPSGDSVDAGDAGPSATAAATPGINAADLEDAIAAARCLLPAQAIGARPAFFLDQRQSVASKGGDVTGYSQDGAPIIPWNGAGTFLDAFFDGPRCVAPASDGEHEVMWTCARTAD